MQAINNIAAFGEGPVQCVEDECLEGVLEEHVVAGDLLVAIAVVGILAFGHVEIKIPVLPRLILFEGLAKIQPPQIEVVGLHFGKQVYDRMRPAAPTRPARNRLQQSSRVGNERPHFQDEQPALQQSENQESSQRHFVQANHVNHRRSSERFDAKGMYLILVLLAGFIPRLLVGELCRRLIDYDYPCRPAHSRHPRSP